MHFLTVTSFLLLLAVSQLLPLDSVIIKCKEHNGEVNNCKHTIEDQENSKGRSLNHPAALQSNYSKPEESTTETTSSEDLIVPILASPAVGTLAGGGLGR